MTFEQVLWLFSDGVLIAVLGLAIARRAWRFLPWFVIYLTLVVVVDLARWIVFVRSGYASRTYSLVYWLTQPVLVAARAAVLADVCRAALSYYRGVWQLTRYLLGGTAAVLLAVAFARTVEKPGFVPYFLFAERELEFSIVVILLLLLFVSRYYGIELGQPLTGIIFGLVFYSSFVVINTSILVGPLALQWEFFRSVPWVTYLMTLALWARALRLPFSAPVRPPLAASVEFEAASGVVDLKMRELNTRILQLMKR